MVKAEASGADAVILDLEDSVPAASKEEARSLVARTITELKGRGGAALWVRVNGRASGLMEEDLRAVVEPGLAAISLPKVESVEEVHAAARLIEEREEALGMPRGSVEIVLMIESALGVYRTFELARASERVAATCLAGARDGDLQTDLGCSWSIEGTELLYARSKVLLDTRAAGSRLLPLDGVFSDLGDEEGLFADCRLSARLGYLGRTVIHPKQIGPVRRAYAVPQIEVAYYKRVVAEFAAALKAGAAAITVDGKLVDYAMAERAKRVLDLAKLDADNLDAEN